MTLTCSKCGARPAHWSLKEGVCLGCRNPERIIVAKEPGKTAKLDQDLFNEMYLCLRIAEIEVAPRDDGTGCLELWQRIKKVLDALHGGKRS